MATKLAMVIAEKGSKPEGYLFDGDLKINEKVVVENETGIFVGVVSGFSKANLTEKPNYILRIATEQDLNKQKENEIKAKDALKVAKENAKKYDFYIKIVTAEYSLDKSKIVFTFVSESRVDFRNFVKELANHFKVRIELKQIGGRDEVKLVGGLGPCGKPCCCANFLPDFAKVSIRMAKSQNLSLNPQKINGLCGRLMCCLSYENDVYHKIMQKMPKLNSEVDTPEGKGIVTYQDILKEKVTVKITYKDDSFAYKDFDLNSIKVKIYANKD